MNRRILKSPPEMVNDEENNMIYDQNFRKRLTGRLIRYYRATILDTENDRRFIQKEFCKGKDANEANICSLRTMKSIENGDTVSVDIIYSRLAAKLELKYQNIIEINNQLETLFTKVRHAIEFHNRVEKDKLYLEIEKIFHETEDVIYYRDIKELLLTLLDFVFDENKVLSEKFINKYKNMIKDFDSSMISLFYICIFNGCVRNKRLRILYGKDAIENLMTLPLDHSDIYYPIIVNCVYQKYFVDAIDYCLAGLELAKQTDNIYYQIILRVELGRVCRETGLEAVNYFFEALDLAKQHQDILDNNVFESIYLNIAEYYYLSFSYKDAIKYYESAIQLNIHSYPPKEVIKLIDCYEKESENQKLKKLLAMVNGNLNHYDIRTKDIFKFYLLKHGNTPNVDLIRYIVKVLNNQVDPEEIFRSVLTAELKRLAISTRLYKSFVDFYRNPSRPSN